jgi:hypothetical protein
MDEIRKIQLADDGSIALAFHRLSGSGYLIRNTETGEEYALTDVTKVDEAIDQLASDMKSGIKNSLKQREVTAVTLAIVMDQRVEEALIPDKKPHKPQNPGERSKEVARMKIEKFTENETQRPGKFSFDRGPKKDKEKPFNSKDADKFAKMDTDKEEYEKNEENSENETGYDIVNDKANKDSKVSQHKVAFKGRGKGGNTDDGDDDDSGND